MIPVLFPAGTTEFSTNGLGRMADATDCTVVEERNGAYELTMTYPVTGVHFSDLRLTRILYAKPADGKGPQPFDIYAISKPVNGICEINAQHISYRLSFIPVEPFTAESAPAALLELKAKAVESCPFSFRTDKSTGGSFQVEEPSSIRSLLGGKQGSLLDVYGGEWEFDRYEVKLHGDRGQDRDVTLRYGKNITDIRQEENIANTYTGIMPYWKGTTESEENGESREVVILLPERVLHSQNAANFPFQRTIPLDLSDQYEAPPTEAQLRATATSYMQSNHIGVPSVNVEVRFVPLWQTEEYQNVASLERVNLCDTVSVEFVKLGISTKAKVVKTEYDVLRERYKSIEIGDSRTNFAQAVSTDLEQTTEKVKQKASVFEVLMKAEIDRATKLLRNPGESHVRFYREDPEQGMILGSGAMEDPEGMLIMDTTDAATAVNVLIINKSGIGFSHTGINGDYEYSWTLDGRFTTEFIATWELMVNIIRLYGLMEVHENAEATFDDQGNLVADPIGGYLGYGEGRIDEYETTKGIMLSNTNNDRSIGNRRYVIATDAGVRMTAGNQHFYLLDDYIDGQMAGSAVLKVTRDFLMKIQGSLKVEKDGVEHVGICGNPQADYELQLGNGNLRIVNGLIVGASEWKTENYRSDIDDILRLVQNNTGTLNGHESRISGNETGISNLVTALSNLTSRVSALENRSNVAVFG